MSLKKSALIALALFAIAGAVQATNYAGLTMQWGPGQVYFEAYNNGAYYYTTSPYQYYGHNYYYFPSNFRYYYNSQWFYQNSGWFYYNGPNWYRDNSWVFSGNYWFQPSLNYYYYPTAFDPKTISVQELDKPYCYDIDIATSPIFVNEGETAFKDFYIDNKSNFDFEIYNAKIIEADSELTLEVFEKDSFIPANSSGTITLKARADSGIESKSTTAYLRIEGSFSNGKSCSFQEISESFQTYVKGIETEPAANEGGEFKTVIEFSSPSIPADAYYSNTAGNYYPYNTQKTSYKGTAGFAQPTACSNIVSYTKTFFLSKNDSKTQYFTVKNDSDNAFYIESIQAFDDSEYFTTAALKANGTSINAHGTIQVPVKVESFENSAGKTAAGTFKISGVFEDNSYCSTGSVGSNEFSISAIAEEPAEATGDLQLLYPERIEVSTKGQASFTLTIINSTGNSGYIKVYCNEAVVDPVAVSLSGATSQTATITVRGLDVNAGWIVFDIFLPSMQFNSRIAKIVKVKAQQTPTPIPAPTPNQQQSISTETSITPAIDGSYDLNVTVTNQGNSTVSGDIEIEVPEGWQVKGDKGVSLRPFESKSIMLKAVPKEFNDEDLQATVLFKSDNGMIFSEPILLKANKPFYSTAFAILGANAFLLGLIVLIVIILTVAYSVSKKQKQDNKETRQNWAFSGKN